METIYIPFGSDCSIAYQIEKHGKRNASYPFDWIKSTIKGIEKCIEEDFKNFTNKNCFVSKNVSGNFPLVNDRYDEGIITNTIRMVNTIYGFHHLHDFPIDQNTSEGSLAECMEKNFISCKEKYDRRINRFVEVMKNCNIKKILIHIGPESDKSYLESNIIPLFESKSYSNYEFLFIPYKEFEMVRTSDWTRNEYPWANIFFIKK